MQIQRPCAVNDGDDSTFAQRYLDGRFTLGSVSAGRRSWKACGALLQSPAEPLRGTVEILRMAFRGEKLAFEGKYHTLPRQGGEGKAIRLNHKPAEIPIFLATLAPKSLEFTGRGR